MREQTLKFLGEQLLKVEKNLNEQIDSLEFIRRHKIEFAWDAEKNVLEKVRAFQSDKKELIACMRWIKYPQNYKEDIRL